MTIHETQGSETEAESFWIPESQRSRNAALSIALHQPASAGRLGLHLHHAVITKSHGGVHEALRDWEEVYRALGLRRGDNPSLLHHLGNDLPSLSSLAIVVKQDPNIEETQGIPEKLDLMRGEDDRQVLNTAETAETTVPERIHISTSLQTALALLTTKDTANHRPLHDQRTRNV